MEKIVQFIDHGFLTGKIYSHPIEIKEYHKKNQNGDIAGKKTGAPVFPVMLPDIDGERGDQRKKERICL